MNRIYQSMKIIPLILILVCSVSFADASLESYRIDSNNSVTQKLNDGKLLVDFVTSQAISLKNATLSINNILLNRSDYHLNCDMLENSAECTITINPVNTLLMNGKIILRAEDGTIITASNSNHELVFTLDKSNPNKLKISNSLIDQSVIIDTVNSKSVLTSFTLAPLGVTVIDLPEDSITLKCSVNNENLIYTVKKTNLTPTSSDLDMLSNVSGKTLAMIAAGGGGIIVIAASIGALSHKSILDRKIVPKSQKYQKEMDNKITKINLDLASAKAKNISAKFTATNNCTLTQDNLEIGKKVTKLIEKSTSAIDEAEENLQKYKDNLLLDEINFIQILDRLNEAKTKAEYALEKAKEAEELAKTCTNKLKDKKRQLERARRKQNTMAEEEQSLSKSIQTINRDITTIQHQQDKLNSASLEWQNLESSKKSLRRKLEALERDQRQSVANYDEQQSVIEQTEQEVSQLNTLQNQQLNALIDQLQLESETTQEQASEQPDSLSDTSKFALSTSTLRKKIERKFSDSIEEITPQLQNPTIVYNPNNVHGAPIYPQQNTLQPFDPSGHSSGKGLF